MARIHHRLRDLPRTYAARLHGSVRGLEPAWNASLDVGSQQVPPREDSRDREGDAAGFERPRGSGSCRPAPSGGCPPLDLICLPGGAGIVDAIADVETIDFIRGQGRAEYVTSVCMGAFLLGAAGLLKGRRAATHWAYVDLLPLVGATHEKARVVRDGNLFTAGGVTAGIDFGFSIVAELAGPEVAQAVLIWRISETMLAPAVRRRPLPNGRHVELHERTPLAPSRSPERCASTAELKQSRGLENLSNRLSHGNAFSTMHPVLRKVAGARFSQPRRRRTLLSPGSGRGAARSGGAGARARSGARSR